MNKKNIGYMIAAGALIEERVEVPVEASRLEVTAVLTRFEVHVDGEPLTGPTVAGPFEAGQVVLVRVQNKTNGAASFDAVLDFVPMTDGERIDRLRKKLEDANARADGFHAQLLGLNRTLESDQAKAKDVEREFAIQLDAVRAALVKAVDRLDNLPGGESERAAVEALRVDVAELRKENAQLRATVERVDKENAECFHENGAATANLRDACQDFEKEAREAFAATAEGLAVLSEATSNATALATALEKRLEGDAATIAEQFTQAGVERAQLAARCEELGAALLHGIELHDFAAKEIRRLEKNFADRFEPVERRAFISRRDLVPLERRTALLFKQVFGVDVPLHPAVGGPEPAPAPAEPAAQEGLPFEPFPPPDMEAGGPETPRSAT